jgi:WD40 repeat protein
LSCTATTNDVGQGGSSYLELARDIGEAANFATYFTGSPAAESTPHLYISALATWLQDTSLSRNWKNQFTRIPVFTHTKGSIDLPLMTVSAGGNVWAVACSSDGTRIVSGSGDNSVRVWDASTGVELKELRGHTSWVFSVAFSSDGTRIVSGSDDNSVRVWDVSTGVELKELRGHTSWVFSVAFSSDGTRIVSGSDDNSVRVWDVSTGVELKELKGHTSWVFSVAFSSDGTHIVSGSGDNSVRVWNASTGVELKELKGHTSWVFSVAFSSDGMRIVSGSRDDSVWVWDAPMIGYEHFAWNLTDKSWIISQCQDHLLWVPKEATLAQPFNILVISPSGFATVDFHQSMIGVDWIHCYTPCCSTV